MLSYLNHCILPFRSLLASKCDIVIATMSLVAEDERECIRRLSNGYWLYLKVGLEENRSCNFCRFSFKGIKLKDITLPGDFTNCS